MFAVAEIAGKQYKIQEKQKLTVDLLEQAEGEQVVVDKVLLYALEEESDIVVGKPYIEGGSVELRVLGSVKGDKIRVFKMKSKKRYSRTQGHRQKYTEVEVIKINFGGISKPVKKVQVEEEKSVSEKKKVEKKEVKTTKKVKAESNIDEKDQMSLL